MEMLMEHVMKTYTGVLKDTESRAQTVTVNIVKRVVGSSAATVEKYELPLEPSLRLTHQPEGFQWGGQGMGCRQLALAILLDLTGNEVVSLRLYQEFKRHLIATSGNRLVITEPDIRAWIAIQGKQEA